MAPAGTPPEVIRKLQDTVIDLAKDPSMIAHLAEQGAVPFAGTSADLAKLSGEETERWKRIIDSADVQTN
ncbi:hypothetical protein G6F31_020167 [Rhizopus arrhizus]|nr:hypothetical protein G6F31_020167 [Rhizopus arrhizus]